MNYVALYFLRRRWLWMRFGLRIKEDEEEPTSGDAPPAAAADPTTAGTEMGNATAVTLPPVALSTTSAAAPLPPPGAASLSYQPLLVPGAAASLPPLAKELTQSSTPKVVVTGVTPPVATNVIPQSSWLPPVGSEWTTRPPTYPPAAHEAPGASYYGYPQSGGVMGSAPMRYDQYVSGGAMRGTQY